MCIFSLPPHCTSDAVIVMDILISPNYPEWDLWLLLLLENMVRDPKPRAEFDMLTYADPGCVLESLESQVDAGRAEG